MGELDPAHDALLQAPDPTFILYPVRDESGTIVELVYSFLNDAALSLFGMTSDDVLGKGLLEIFPSARDIGLFDAARAIDTQDDVEATVSWIDETEVQRTFTMKAVPHRDGVLVTAADLTATMVAESKLRHQLLAETSGEIVYRRSPDGVVEWVSPSVTHLLGWSREEFIGSQLHDLIHPDDVGATESVQPSAGDGGAAPGAVEMRFATAAGGWRWMSTFVRDIRNDSAGVIGSVNTLRDVQSEVEARHALELAALDLNAAQRMAGLASWTWRPATDRVLWSEKLFELFGLDPALPPPDFAAQAKLYPTESFDRMNAAIAELTDTGAPYDLEVEYFHAHSGRGWLRTWGEAVRDDQDVLIEVRGFAQDVTQQVAARQAVEQSEQTLRATQRMARLGSWEWDIATDRVEWSEELYELFGLDPTQPPPGFAEQARFYEAESWAIASAAVAETGTAGTPYDLELEIIRANSKRGWIHVRGEAVRDEHDLIVGLRGFVLDITERAEALRALERSASDLSEAPRLARMGSWRHDLITSELTWSAEIYEMFGLDPALPAPTLTGYLAHLTPESADRLRAARAEADNTGTSYELELEFVRSDSRHGWMRSRADPVRDEHGVVVEVRGYAQDITEEVEARRLLERSDQALRETQRMARLGSWEWDIATNRVEWSEELYELFGLDPTQPPPSFAEQKSLYEVTSWKIANATVAATARSGEPYDLEVQIIRTNAARRWLHVRGEAVRDELGVIVGLRGFALDITDRAEALRALERSASDLSRAQQLARMGSWRHDIITNELTWSAEVYEMFGLDPALPAPTIEENLQLLTSESGDRLRTAMADANDAAASYDLELEFIRSDSRHGWMRSQGELIRNEQGVVVEVQGYAQDITEEVQARRLLERSDQALRATQRMARLGSWEVDIASGQAEWSEELYELFGLDPAFPPPNSADSSHLFESESWERITPAMAEARRTGVPFLLEAEIIRADATRRWVEIRAEAVRDDRAVIVGLRGFLMDITDRVEATRALERSALDLSEAQRLARMGSWRLDTTTDQVTWSAEVYEMMGLDHTVPTPTRQGHAEVFTAETAARLNAALAETTSSGAPYELELEFIRSDSRHGWMRSRGEAIRDDHGAIVEVRGYAQDITDQVEARQMLERSDQTLRATQRMARLGSWEWDMASDQAEWSDEMYELFGLDPADPAPPHTDQMGLYGPNSWPGVSDALATTAQTGVSSLVEGEIVRADASRGWVQVRGEAVRDAHGAIVGLRGFVLDITERRQAERALASSELLFRTAMLASPIGMAMIEVDGSFRVVNESLCELVGRDEAWLTTHTIHDVAHPDDLELLLRDWQAVIDGDAVTDFQPLRLVNADDGVLRVKRAAELIVDASGGPDYLLVQYVDTTVEHAALKDLAHQASHDPLTGLRNRAGIMDLLEADLGVTPGSGKRIGVLFIDLDNFKIVNDSLGHAAGDDVLITVAERITSALGSSDRCGRSGGDEFIVVVPDVTDAARAGRIAERIVSAVGTELMIRGHRIVPTVSIGIALSTPDSTSASLLRDADAALFRAKEAGRSRWQLFDDAMHIQALGRLTIEGEIRRGLGDAEFVVHYQPIVRLEDRQVVGHEALVRWEHPVRGLLFPLDFLETAEDSGLIVDIGQSVLEQVCELLDSRSDLPGPISVNFSPVQLAHANWLQVFTDTLARSGVDPQRIIVEVTETAVMTLLPGTRDELLALRELGVGLHVDDFGTGFSSISLLRDMPVNGLKLDKSFVADLDQDDDATNALSSGLAGLVTGLHLLGTAEGVESEAQDRILLGQGWSHAQGYLYGRPAPEPSLASLTEAD
jgi:diguanylate cyclase (GGDEF)-like protein/PAS domain S-box-containing protein